MYDVFAEYMDDVFTTINHIIKKKKQQEGWTVKKVIPSMCYSHLSG